MTSQNVTNLEISHKTLCHHNPYTGELLDTPYEETTYALLANPGYNAAAIDKVRALQASSFGYMSYRTLRGAVDAHPEATVAELAAMLRK